MSTMKETLEIAHITLQSATSNPQILALLTQCGYGVERLQEGLALYYAANEALQLQSAALLSKVKSTETFNGSWKDAQFHFQQDLRAARKALRQSSGSASFLQLNVKSTRIFGEWYAQAKAFYTGLNRQPELQEVAAKSGLTGERITQGLQYLELLESLRIQQNSQKSSAGSTLRQSNEAIAAFLLWMNTFRKYARLALASQPEMIASLNLKSSARRSKKPATTFKVEIPSFDTANLLMAG